MDKIEIFENERATGYDKFVETWIPKYHYFLDILPKLLSGIEQKKLLVVGCGTGNEIQRFIQITEPCEVTGVDPSPEMMNQAKERFKDCNNVTLIEGLLSELDIKKKYNVAILSLVLHFFDDNGDKLNLLKDIAERLVSGSTFVIFDITGNKQQMKQNLNVLKCLLPVDLDVEQVNNRLNRIENELFAVSEERLSELLQEAGFQEPFRFFQSSIYMGWLTKKK